MIATEVTAPGQGAETAVDRIRIGLADDTEVTSTGFCPDLATTSEEELAPGLSSCNPGITPIRSTRPPRTT
jgi:hypothetical protein